jgi:hypothetical protein
VKTPKINSLSKTKYKGLPTTFTPKVQWFQASFEDLSSKKLAKPINAPIFKILPKDSINSKNIIQTYSNENGKRKAPFVYTFLPNPSESKGSIDESGCKTTYYDFNCNSSTFMSADYESEAQYIYPSAIYNMQEFENANFNEITKNRNDITLSIDVPDIKTNTFITVNNPNIITLREGIRSLFENFDDNKAGSMDFRYRIFESNSDIERQLKTTAGGGISFGTFGGAQSDNTWEEDQNQSHHYITVDIIKDLFTITSYPNEQYFSVNPTDSNELVMVNSVTYGMRLLANIDVTNLIEEKTSQSNNKASFIAANGHLNLSSLEKSLGSQTTINCYVVGGPINGRCSFTVENFESEINHIVEGTNFNNARPIQYSLSDLNGNIFSIQSSVTKIPIKECVAHPKHKIEYAYLDVITGDDEKDRCIDVNYALYDGNINPKTDNTRCFSDLRDDQDFINRAHENGLFDAGDMIGVNSTCSFCKIQFDKGTNRKIDLHILSSKAENNSLTDIGGAILIKRSREAGDWRISSIVLHLKFEDEPNPKTVSWILNNRQLRPQGYVYCTFNKDFIETGVHP